MYVGRFAPSPTGPLHFGSLLAAMASYLEARSHQGQWLLRIEDIDKPREKTGAADAIIRTLERYRFNWDGDILFQSTRLTAYQQALQQLEPVSYHCTCSRRTLRATAATGEFGLIYPGTCRYKDLASAQQPACKTQQFAIRVFSCNHIISFDDQVQGAYAQQLSTELGDFIVRRADGLLAYQLAVVVDDDWQGVTHVVRGADLLDNTPRQICLQNYLGHTTPTYMHIPLALNPDGQKLSKHTHAPALPDDDNHIIVKTLCQAMRFLGQLTPAATDFDHPNDVWQWAIAHWDNRLIPDKIALPRLP